MRPFSLSAGVGHHTYSLPLQRAVTDFGADNAFGQVNKKLKEHYGITLPSHAGRTITLTHAEKIEQKQAKELGQIRRPPVSDAPVISETDGSMVPIVTINKDSKDKRKGKKVQYREARLTLAHEAGIIAPIFSATLDEVDEAGKHITHCINKAGAGTDTKIHAVGDGAVWISNQLEENFGSRATYLIDFYHVCEYLAAAALSCAPQDEKNWTDQQKDLLKSSGAKKVLMNLLPYIEQQHVEDKDAPVRRCHRYLQNRLHQLDYKSAIENDLPIGSGEIESAHRYVIQCRMKIQGAWWSEENAANILALRINRANNEWEGYWSELAA